MKSKRNCPVCQFEPGNGHAPDCPHYVDDMTILKRIMSQLGKKSVAKRHEGKSEKWIHDYYKEMSRVSNEARKKPK
jgi:hypothetical protein